MKYDTYWWAFPDKWTWWGSAIENRVIHSGEVGILKKLSFSQALSFDLRIGFSFERHGGSSHWSTSAPSLSEAGLLERGIAADDAMVAGAAVGIVQAVRTAVVGLRHRTLSTGPRTRDHTSRTSITVRT